MMNIINKIAVILLTFMAIACADNDLGVTPKDGEFPFRLILDTDEGGDLPDAEDYSLEVKFADFIGDLPDTEITVDFEISDLEDDMVGNVVIDEIVYEVDDEEFTLDFTSSMDGLTGTIILNDPITGKIPEEFEIIFTLPGGAAEGSFKFSLSNLQANGANVILGTPNEFEYEVLDHELAGGWIYEIDNEEDLEAFKDVWGSISKELAELSFSDVMEDESIEVELEFEYEEVKVKIVYLDTEGEELEIEIEGEYDFDDEDSELEIEGSYFVYGDDGQIEGEPDFVIEAEYGITGDILTVTIYLIIDEDNYEEGEELFADEEGVSFVFEKD